MSFVATSLNIAGFSISSSAPHHVASNTMHRANFIVNHSKNATIVTMNKRPASTIEASKIKTPAFVIEEEILRHNLSILKEIREKTGAKILHALKAWATWELLPMEREYLDGTEVSSLNEARLGFEEF